MLLEPLFHQIRNIYGFLPGVKWRDLILLKTIGNQSNPILIQVRHFMLQRYFKIFNVKKTIVVLFLAHIKI